MPFLGEAVRLGVTVANTNTQSGNFLINIPVGSMVVLATNDVSLNPWNTPTVTDTKGNTWTVRIEDHTTPTNRQFVLFTMKVTAALTTADTWTLTVAGANPAKWTVLALAFDDATSYDVSSHTVGAGSSITSADSPAVAQNSQIVVGAHTWTDTTALATTFTPTNGSTAVPFAAATDRVLVMTYKYVNEAGPRLATGTLTPGQGWLGSVTAINAAGGGVVSDSPVFWFNGAGVWVPVDIVIM